MEATKDHISLETAKLLKDCGIESKYKYNSEGAIINPYLTNVFPIAPAYTWQEILWEYAQEFFGEDIYESDGEYCHTCSITELKRTTDILDLLQQKKYKEADLYFRESCILIKEQ